jgi:hypothetical protein
MDCRLFRESLRAWLEASWQTQAPNVGPAEDLVRHSEVCTDCRQRLRVAIGLLGPAGDPAPDFVERVMSALTSAQAGPKELRRTGRIGAPGTLRRPARTGRVWAAAASVFILAVGVWLSVTSGVRFPRMVTVELSFKAPGAAEVAVVGDWNRWNPSADLLVDPDGDGVWEIRLRLKRRTEPRYQFVVDGTTWSPDPNAQLQVDDGFGGVSSVLEI